MSDANNNRREFLQTSLAAGTALGLSGLATGADEAGGKGLPTRALGKTGEKVSIICLGGWHIGSVKDEKEAFRIMHAALDNGLFFFDNAWDYHDGGSEEVMGKALAEGGYRKLVVGIDSMKVLEQDLRIAREFKPLEEAELKALLARVKTVAGDGRHERFKSTQMFDGPYHQKQHGLTKADVEKT